MLTGLFYEVHPEGAGSRLSVPKASKAARRRDGRLRSAAYFLFARGVPSMEWEAGGMVFDTRVHIRPVALWETL